MVFSFRINYNEIMKKLIIVILLTFSSLSASAEEDRFEGVINPLQQQFMNELLSQ